jgi:phospholipid transport system substrate-binding protein
MKWTMAAVALASVMMSFTARAIAQPKALDFLEGRHDAVRGILKDDAATPSQRGERNERLAKALADLIDYEELSQRALRDHWAELSTADRREFVNLLSRLVERNYQQNLESTLDFKVRYESEETGPDGTIVHTVARSRQSGRAPEVAIDYTMVRDGQAWKVYDITTDGVSLVTNYRSQFNRIIREHGFETLLHRMQKRLEQGDGVL